MNIDTLKTRDGNYREARYIDIDRCLNAPHVTHLQRNENVVAIRPTMDGDTITGWDLTLAPNGIDMITTWYPNSDKRWQGTTDRLQIIARIATFLNHGALVGSDRINITGFQANDSIEVPANQADREGWVLAVIGKEMLVEYIMPAGTSALRVMKALAGRITDSAVRTYPYRNVPKRWVHAMHDQGTNNWEGRCQRSTGRVPFPADDRVKDAA